MRRAQQLPGLLLLVTMLASTGACGGVSTGSGAAGDRALPRGSVTGAVLVAQPVVLVPNTIDYTGAADVTNVLQNLIDNVDDGVILRFRANGKYRVEGTLFVTNKSGITFDGQNATIFATSPGTLERAQWWITGGDSLIFRRFTVRGSNPHAGTKDQAYDPKKEKQHGFRIEATEGIQLDHVTVTDVWGDFVYVGRYNEVPATNVWIHDSVFKRNGRQGIALVATNNVIIERNTITDTRRGTLDLEPNGPNQVVKNVFILNNTIGVGRLLFIASHGKGPVTDIVISGNKMPKHLLNIDVVPLKNQRRKNWIISNNTSGMLANARPIRFAEVDGVRVSGNVQKVGAGKPAVQLVDVCGAQVTGNDFGGAGVLKQGTVCNYTIVTPAMPSIPGRP